MDIGDATLGTVQPKECFSQAAQDWHYLRLLPQLLGEIDSPVRFLDLGAGNGRSYGVARTVCGADKVTWTGVDIPDSTEHLNRPDDAPAIDEYDGVNLPYTDGAFDVIWCKQVLEHVRYPDKTLAEVARVLRPGGLFIGSVSQLEPYHSRSIFNWTHYGIRTVFADHQLEVDELTPGVDGLLLMLRSVFGLDIGLNKFFTQESPFNLVVSALFENAQSSPQQNSEITWRQRLKIAGHIHFLARRTATVE